MIKSFEVVGVTHDGEAVCQDCMTKLEEKVANDQIEIDDINPIFAESVGDTVCDRCGCPILS